MPWPRFFKTREGLLSRISRRCIVRLLLREVEQRTCDWHDTRSLLTLTNDDVRLPHFRDEDYVRERRLSHERVDLLWFRLVLRDAGPVSEA